MRQVVVLSGKGGTGKTTVVASLAHLASQEASVVLADADVDAANLELVLSPKEIERHEFSGGKEAVILPEPCTACGRCAEVCRFDAVLVEDDGYRVDPTACEGCASCFYQCPADAIEMRDRQSGLWFRSETRFGPLFHAHLYPGQENSGKLVSLVRQQAALWGVEHGVDYVIIDGPPGIGCPVIAACGGVHLALLVAEPTIAGVHDLERVLATTEHFRVPAAVAVNMCDINPRRTEDIAVFCHSRDIPLVGRIPFDTAVTKAMVQGQPVTVFGDGAVSQELRRVWHALRAMLYDQVAGTRA